jgi:hypothetical protein
MGPKAEYLDLARKLLAGRADREEREIELAYELQAAGEHWLAKNPPK